MSKSKRLKTRSSKNRPLFWLCLSFFRPFVPAVGMSGEDRLPAALLRQARGSGQLNLSNRRLKEVPESVWRINLDASAEAARSGEALSFDSEDRWWEQQELQRLILASNALTELSDGGESWRRKKGTK